MQPRTEISWLDRLPWELTASEFGKFMRKVVPCDSAMLGLHFFPKANLDEVLAAWGWKSGQLAKWFAHAPGQDRAVKAAIKGGIAIGTPVRSTGDMGPASDPHILHIIFPECVIEKSSWHLMLTRKQRAFKEKEILSAAVMLRQWQCAFVQPPEPMMNRIVLGHDHRLILTNIASRKSLAEKPKTVELMAGHLFDVIAQRYPTLEDDHIYDMALKFDNDAYWVRFKRRRWSKAETGHQWYLELRPVGADELPTVGVLKDDRIASAVAYLHQHFSDAPSLAQVARYVHMSPFHFHRLFSKQVGTSPKQYLLRMQLHMAKWKLRATRSPINLIAEHTGFSSHGHFTSTFHRIVGISPSEYRQNN